MPPIIGTEFNCCLVMGGNELKKKRKVRTQAGSCPTISRDNIKRDPLWLEHCAAIRAERSTSRRLHSQWLHCLFHLRSRVGQWPSMRQLLFVWSDDRGSLASTKMHLTSSSNSSSSFLFPGQSKQMAYLRSTLQKPPFYWGISIPGNIQIEPIQRHNENSNGLN